jgi:osmotically-inducible protein OsmY
MSAAYRYPRYEETARPQTDAFTREIVAEALRGCSDLDATDIDVYIANGEATLIGIAENIDDSELAERVAEGCPGVSAVFNQLRLSMATIGHPADGPRRDLRRSDRGRA